MARSLAKNLFPWLVAVIPLGQAVACGSADQPPARGSSTLPSGVFGGAAGVIDPKLDASTEDSPSGLVDVCADVPQGQLALVDDFDDGDSAAVPENEREAYWFPSHDESTTGMMNQPDKFTPLAAGVNGSSFAAHLTASGYTVWGAGFDANITHLAGGIRCPYNASKFTGFRFYAKGSGQVRVALPVPEVIDILYGGKCDSSKETCYDTHGILITLSPDWAKYELPWAAFTQRHFGTQLPFDPHTIMQINFSFETPNLPVDAWFDTVGFMDGSAFPDPAPSDGAAGQGGQAGGP